MDRARDAADQRARRAGGVGGLPGVVIGVVADVQARGVHADMDRLETEVAREVSFTGANAEAVSFTCRPCGRTLPLEEGAYNPANRVLCETCFAADAEARRNLRRPSEWKTIAIVMVVFLAVVAGFYGCTKLM